MRVQFRKKVIGERTGAMSGTSKIPERFSAVPGFPTKSVSGNYGSRRCGEMLKVDPRSELGVVCLLLGVHLF